jgi:GNAT superfamily N-acetyltransferase
MIADELFWWSEGREGVKLLQAYEQWAAGFGAVVRMTTLEAVNPDRMTRFFARRGYQPLERAFVKVG